MAYHRKFPHLNTSVYRLVVWPFSFASVTDVMSSFRRQKIFFPLFLRNQCYYAHAHTHAHPFNGPLSGTTRVSRYHKGKPIWILLKQETVSGSGISWAICKSAPRSRQITMPAPHHSVFLKAGCPSCHPTNSVKALKAIVSSIKHSECRLTVRMLCIADLLGSVLRRLPAVCVCVCGVAVEVDMTDIASVKCRTASSCSELSCPDEFASRVFQRSDTYSCY